MEIPPPISPPIKNEDAIERTLHDPPFLILHLHLCPVRRGAVLYYVRSTNNLKHKF